MEHHGRGLYRLVKDADLVAQLKEDYTNAALHPADRAMLDYAAKLSRTPGAMSEADIEALRTVGFSDRAILDIVQITAYYAYVNRIADGLGVLLEGEGAPPEAETPG